MDTEPDSPRTAFADIEISPSTGRFWGGTYQTNILKVIQHWVILSFSWKWKGGKQITKGLPHYPGYKPGDLDDYAITKELHSLVDEADIVVAQNGDKFDFKKISTRIAFHRLAPPSPIRSVDTLKVMRSKFGLESNKLKDAAEFFQLPVGKLDNEGYPMWEGCMAGDLVKWANMLVYNERDTVVLEMLYEYILPWISNHPNLAAWSPTTVCPKCGSKELRSKGWRVTQAGGRYRKIQCFSCGGWSHSPVNESTHRPIKPI